MTIASIITFIIVGLIIAFAAKLFIGAVGLIIYLVIAGILGSFVGGFLFEKLGVKLKTKNPLVAKIITAGFGAVVVIVVFEAIF